MKCFSQVFDLKIGDLDLAFYEPDTYVMKNRHKLVLAIFINNLKVLLQKYLVTLTTVKSRQKSNKTLVIFWYVLSV